MWVNQFGDMPMLLGNSHFLTGKSALKMNINGFELQHLMIGGDTLSKQKNWTSPVKQMEVPRSRGPQDKIDG
jgi:hypothetical protein